MSYVTKDELFDIEDSLQEMLLIFDLHHKDEVGIDSARSEINYIRRVLGIKEGA